jgi:phosphate starvation-inducible PhoH-like protein
MADSEAVRTKVVVELPEGVSPRQVFGRGDRYLRQLREAFGVSVVARDRFVQLDGSASAVGGARQALEAVLAQAAGQGDVTGDAVTSAIREVEAERTLGPVTRIETLVAGKHVLPRTPGQGVYVTAASQHDLVFCIGPAGTGKTYLAVGLAVQALKRMQVKKIVLARPAVEAGEKLGFLPGDLIAKINPYLRPLYDALEDMMSFTQLRRHMDADMIEVIPLAFMRGRTLNDAFIILDEAQNSTGLQMKMFLTRLGVSSRVIINGDVSQVDLPPGQVSGLKEAERILRGVKGMEFVYLTARDIVRHPLVSNIVRAYERDDRRREPRRPRRRAAPPGGERVPPSEE